MLSTPLSFPQHALVLTSQMKNLRHAGMTMMPWLRAREWHGRMPFEVYSIFPRERNFIRWMMMTNSSLSLSLSTYNGREMFCIFSQEKFQ
jgi:hypothetical protein